MTKSNEKILNGLRKWTDREIKKIEDPELKEVIRKDLEREDSLFNNLNEMAEFYTAKDTVFAVNMVKRYWPNYIEHMTWKLEESRKGE